MTYDERIGRWSRAQFSDRRRPLRPSPSEHWARLLGDAARIIRSGTWFLPAPEVAASLRAARRRERDPVERERLRLRAELATYSVRQFHVDRSGVLRERVLDVRALIARVERLARLLEAAATS